LRKSETPCTIHTEFSAGCISLYTAFIRQTGELTDCRHIMIPGTGWGLERMNVLPAFDADRLKTLLGNDQSLFKQLEEITAEEFPQHMQTVEAAYETLDFKTISAKAHTLKGSMANAGGLLGSHYAEKLQHAADERDRQACGAYIPLLKTAIQDFLLQFSTFLQKNYNSHKS